MNLVEQFLYDKEHIQLKSRLTVKNYEIDLRHTIPSLTNKQSSELTIEDIKGITPKQVVHMMEGMKKDYAPTSIARKLASLKDFYKYYSNLKGFENVLANVVKPNDERIKEIECIEGDKIQELLAIARKENPRDTYIFSMLFGLGVRSNELLTITKEMIHEDFVIVRGKGNKLRTIPMNNTVQRAVKDYLAWRGDFEGQVLNLTYQGLRHVFTRYNKMVGIDCSRVHTSRHSYGSNLVANGVDITTVSSLLGHSSLDVTTKFYINTEKAKLEAIKNII